VAGIRLQCGNLTSIVGELHFEENYFSESTGLAIKTGKSSLMR